MSRRFNREYKVMFGKRGGDLKSISELRCRFRIEKSVLKTPNTAVIEIYNLNENSRNVLQDEDAIILLEAGYQGNQRGVFVGDVTKVEHRRIDADRVTIVEAGDGNNALNESVISKSYASGTNISNVITDIISTFKGVSFSQNLNTVITSARQLITGGSFEGASEQVLDDLLSSYGLSFSIQDGELLVSGDASLEDSEVQIVSASTGLIQSPAKTDTGVSFEMLLEPRIRPGSFIQLDSESIKGLYRATKVVHDGDNFDKNWYTQIEAEVAT